LSKFSSQCMKHWYLFYTAAADMIRGHSKICLVFIDFHINWVLSTWNWKLYPNL
jgi:hypothetical protein